MPRLTPVHWRVLECIFLLDGFTFERKKGDHNCYSKPDVLRPVVIPRYSEVAVDIIMSNMRTAGMARERYLSLFEKCKGKA
jgi:predicted RNA binding protein YcfA (HicA-like mRNA interferase family)